MRSALVVICCAIVVAFVAGCGGNKGGSMTKEEELFVAEKINSNLSAADASVVRKGSPEVLICAEYPDVSGKKKIRDIGGSIPLVIYNSKSDQYWNVIVYFEVKFSYRNSNDVTATYITKKVLRADENPAAHLAIQEKIRAEMQRSVEYARVARGGKI